MPPYNLARFDFVSIRLAVACARTGNLTAAARECHLVVPAASRRLKDLETALGGPLFERHSRGLTSTALGRAFMARGLSILQELDRLVEALEDARQGVVHHIRLCASTAAISQFLAPLLAEHAELRPEVRVELEEQVSGVVLTTLRERRADIGIFVEGPDTDGLEVREFRQDELILVLPVGHALCGRTPLPLVQALDEQWIGLNLGAAVLQTLQEVALAAGRPLRLRMQVRSFDAVGHMVASGLGISVLPKGAALPIVRAMKLAWRPLADGWARRRLLVAVRPDAEAAVVALRDFLHLSSQNAKTDQASLE